MDTEGLGAALTRDEMGMKGLDDEFWSGRMPALRQQRRIAVASTSSHAVLASLRPQVGRYRRFWIGLRWHHSYQLHVEYILRDNLA